MSPLRLSALVLTLAALAGGLALWLAAADGDAPEVSDPFRPPEPAADGLLTLDARQLDRVTIHRPLYNEQLRAELGQDGIWRLSEPVRDWCEPAVLMSALQALYSRDWSVAPAEWEAQSDEQLGLEPARIAVELRGADGAVQVLRIGATELSGRWHAATRDGERIRVGEGVLSPLDRDALDWRDHRLQPLPPPVVRGLRWQAAGGDRLELERAADGWRIVAPFRAPLDPRRAPFLERLLGARAAMIARDALAVRRPQGETLGTLRIVGGDQEFEWTLIGDSLIASHREYPLAWAREDLGVLFLPAEELRSPRVLDFDPGAIVALRVEQGGAEAVFRRGSGGWSLDGMERTLTAEELGLVEGLLRESARLEGRDWGERPDGEPTGRVTFSISRTPRPQPGRVLEWWVDATGRVTAAAADADRATVSDVNFELAVRDLMRRLGDRGSQ